MENEAKYTGVRKSKGGKFFAQIKDPFTKRRIRLGIFNTAEEASNAYLLRKKVFLATPPSVNKRFNSNMDFTTGKEPFISVKSSCSMANVHGTESSSGCISTTVTSNPKAKRNLLGLGVRRQKRGRFTARIRDPISHTRVWLGTFDTVEEASEAYFSKKSEFDKLSKGIKENKPKHSDQIQPESPVGASLSVDIDHTLNVTSVGVNKTISSHETTHFVGVRKRKSGRFFSEIKNPISKKRIYLGTFNSAEEASQAYQTKKLEFQKLAKAKQQCNLKTHSSARAKQDGKEKLVDANQGHQTVNHEGFQLESGCGALSLETDAPMSNSSDGGCDQRIGSHEISHSMGVQKRKLGKQTSEILSETLGTVEEAFNAYQCKKSSFQISKKAELQTDKPTDSSAGENQVGEEDEDLWKGQWVQLPGNKEVCISLKLGVPIIDNYGHLLGEFSSLDDLRIVKH